MSERKTATRAKTKTKIDKETKRQLLYYMKLSRDIEYRIERVLYRQGKIVGGVYVGRGQEAISVCTRRGTLTYRSDPSRVSFSKCSWRTRSRVRTASAQRLRAACRRALAIHSSASKLSLT